MTSVSWKTTCAGVPADISLEQLDRELDELEHLDEDERSALWLYAWASRETAARVAVLTQ